MQQGDAGPALWSAEEPSLYILVLSLIAPDGSHVESESCQVGTQSQKLSSERQDDNIPKSGLLASIEQFFATFCIMCQPVADCLMPFVV